MREIKFRVWEKPQGTFLGNMWDDNDPLFVANCLMNQKNEYEIMQYTGLKDKKGKEIYEGDITTTEISDEPKEVVFWEGCFCHKLDDGRGHIFNPKQIEVIGDIYQNQELLKSTL